MGFSCVLADLYPEIDNIAREFEKVNGSHRITPEYKFDDSCHPQLVRFDQFYQKLRAIISRNPSSIYPPAETPETTPPTQTTPPSVLLIPTTPPPSTNVIDPQYSSLECHSLFGCRVDGRTFYPVFCQRVCVWLVKSLNSIAWYRDTKYELQHGWPAPKDLFLLTSGTIRRCV